MRRCGATMTRVHVLPLHVALLGVFNRRRAPCPASTLTYIGQNRHAIYFCARQIFRSALLAQPWRARMSCSARGLSDGRRAKIARLIQPDMEMDESSSVLV